MDRQDEGDSVMSLRGWVSSLIVLYLLMAVYTIGEVVEFELHKHRTVAERSLEWVRGHRG
jgi:hypothetical protein